MREQLSRLLFLLLLLAMEQSAFGESPLASRFERLQCSVAKIEAQSEQESGSGFFINADGDLITAGHVVFDRSFEQVDGKVTESLKFKEGLRIFTAAGQYADLHPSLTPNDQLNAVFDLAVLQTHLPQPCYIRLRDKSDPNFAHLGDHVIVVGFPGSAYSAPVLYEGFVSSTYIPMDTVGTVDDKPVIRNYRLMRLQMPVTAGASGSPVIADTDDVIGVVTDVPVLLPKDLAALLEHCRTAFSGQPKRTDSPTTILNEMECSLVESYSPGAGVAVPTFFLTLPQPQPSAPPQSSSRPTPTPSFPPHR